MRAVAFLFGVEATKSDDCLPDTAHSLVSGSHHIQLFGTRHETSDHHVQQFLSFDKTVQEPYRNSFVNRSQEVGQELIDLLALKGSELHLLAEFLLFNVLYFLEVIGELANSQLLLQLLHAAAELVCFRSVFHLESPFLKPGDHVEADIVEDVSQLVQ